MLRLEEQSVNRVVRLLDVGITQGREELLEGLVVRLGHLDPDKDAAFERLEQLIVETGRTLVHPFDDPLVMAGQGTVGLEMLEDAPSAEVVLVQVGGGGLVSGIATAVKGLKPDARVIAVEPERSPALHEGLKAGHQVHVEAASAADGVNGPFAGENCVAVC